MFVLAALALVATCTAHVCLIEPHQRGPLSLTEPGDNSCFRRTPYCGGLSPESPTTTLAGGKITTVVFQQNLNHWYPNKPGFFDIALSYDLSPADDSWTYLATFQDFPGNDMVQVTNFSMPVFIPNKASTHAILRIRYVSFNPLEIYPANNTDAIFYNCADVVITASADEDEQPAAPAKAAPPPFDYVSCVTPPRWEATGTTTSPEGTVSHHIWYDAEAQLVRWDRTGALWNATLDSVSLITNYTDLADGPPEYVVYPAQKKCFTYGADGFYNWQYGEQNGMYWYRNYTASAGTIMVFRNSFNGFEWEATADCLPYAMRQTSDATKAVVTTSFQAHVVSSFPAQTFQAPAYCHTMEARHASCRRPLQRACSALFD